VQQELAFCAPSHGAAPQKANEITTTDLALKALGVEAQIGASVPVEFEVRGQTYHYDMVLSGWWEASSDAVSLMIVSEQFIKENPELFQNTYAADRERAGVTFSDVVLKNKVNIKGQLEDFARRVGGDPENMEADNFILCSANQMAQGMTSSETVLFTVIFALLFVVCGYLLIYNVFDISVMQDVRQYGLLRTIGTSPRQIKRLVNRQALRLTLIGLPIGLVIGYFAGWLILPVTMGFFSFEHKSAMSAMQVSTSPLIFVIASLFTILTVYISTRKPAKKAANVSPLEAVRYTEQEDYKRKSARRTHGAKLSRMALSNFGRNKRRSAFIMISLLLCIVFVNSAVIITQSIDEEKFISRSTKTDYTVYNSIVANVYEGFRYHSDELPASVIDFIDQQPGVENGRSLYRNTLDDTDVLVDYGIENLPCTGIWEQEDGRISKSYGGFSMTTAPETENLFYGNIYGASEQFFADLTIFDGERDAEVLNQKMQSGEYVILGCFVDNLTGEPKETLLTEQLQVGDHISFYKEGELFRTYTILARAKVVGMERETNSSTTALNNIGRDAPLIYMTDSMFMQLYDNPTRFSYGFNVSEGKEAQMDAFLDNLTESGSSVAYTSTELLKQQTASIQNIVLLVGGMIAAIMALAGLINFTNMMITSMINR
ncbi:MAG: FtsX-like permease family protein, partial [Lachnospiraceae bacterium]|nr:FtsX-like permease family protein [Lachnospiraceae bacterium]